jgi:hypothetical protein
MKTKLQEALSKIAPNVAVQTIWEHDSDLHDIRKDCDGFESEDPNDWQAWQSEVRASAIYEGEIIYGSAYLGGTWEKWGDNPAKSNPEISGYENQMTEDALEELLLHLDTHDTVAQIQDAIAYLRSERRKEARQKGKPE